MAQLYAAENDDEESLVPDENNTTGGKIEIY